MSEVPKRLTPTSETFRELYLRSGNECAFPGCHARMINEEGVFVGQTCHIEAAEQGGERFNEAQTNEQRRAITNLLLMCYEHHQITNKVDAFPVERMKEIKRNHEAIYSNAIERIAASFQDYTESQDVTHASVLTRLAAFLGWDESPEELIVTAEIYQELANDLKKVPERPRQILSILIQRGSPYTQLFGSYTLRVLVDDMSEACRVSREEMYRQLRILEDHGLIYIDQDDERGDYYAYLKCYDWPLWDELRNYFKHINVPLSELIVEGRFNLLD